MINIKQMAPRDEGAWRVIVSWRNVVLDDTFPWSPSTTYVYDKERKAELRFRKSQRECGKFPQFNTRVQMQTFNKKSWVTMEECFLTPQDSRYHRANQQRRS